MFMVFSSPPAEQKFGITSDAKNNFMFGGQLKFSRDDLNASVSYFNQHRKPKPYSTLRADSLGDVFIQEINPTSSQYQIISADVGYDFSIFEFYSRADFDLNKSKFSRGKFTWS
jgi:hypothetical protein